MIMRGQVLNAYVSNRKAIIHIRQVLGFDYLIPMEGVIQGARSMNTLANTFVDDWKTMSNV
jgi:hypothetical protein